MGWSRWEILKEWLHHGEELVRIRSVRVEHDLAAAELIAVELAGAGPRTFIAANEDTEHGIEDHQAVGIQVEIHVADERIQRLPDPCDGLFDGAGDFDRLIAHGTPALRLLGEIDPNGETRLDASRMPQLVVEVELLLLQATAVAERRGLMRLRALAERCVREQGELLFLGD